MKNALLHGLTAAALSSVAAYLFNYAYSTAMWVDFSAIINAGSIIGSCTFGCMLASLGFFFFQKFVKRGTKLWFNAIFILLTFASMAGSFGATLPLDVESPELFPGLSAALHLFPVLFWIATERLFESKSATYLV